jgi:hypothetical protein
MPFVVIGEHVQAGVTLAAAPTEGGENGVGHFAVAADESRSAAAPGLWDVDASQSLAEALAENFFQIGGIAQGKKCTIGVNDLAVLVKQE